jgi:hypothetical protein
MLSGSVSDLVYPEKGVQPANEGGRGPPQRRRRATTASKSELCPRVPPRGRTCCRSRGPAPPASASGQHASATVPVLQNPPPTYMLDFRLPTSPTPATPPRRPPARVMPPTFPPNVERLLRPDQMGARIGECVSCIGANGRRTLPALPARSTLPIVFFRFGDVVTERHVGPTSSADRVLNSPPRQGPAGLQLLVTGAQELLRGWYCDLLPSVMFFRIPQNHLSPGGINPQADQNRPPPASGAAPRSWARKPVGARPKGPHPSGFDAAPSAARGWRHQRVHRSPTPDWWPRCSQVSPAPGPACGSPGVATRS